MAEGMWTGLGDVLVALSPLGKSANLLWRGTRPGYPSEEVTAQALHSAIETWKNKDITTVISLLTDGEELFYYGKKLCPYYRRVGLVAYKFPVPDGKPMRQELALRMARTVFKTLTEDRKSRVLVHCSAGVGRTSMALGCIGAFLRHRDGMNIQDTGVPQTCAQVKVVEQFELALGGDR